MIHVAAAVIENANKLFAARRKPGIDLAGYWELPGGKIKEGEAPETCLIRELQEEFGVIAEIGSFFGESTYGFGSKTVHLLAYNVGRIEGDFELIDHDELRWLSLDELDSVNWAPADVPLVELYRSLAATTNFYTNNAQQYCEETISLEMSESIRTFQTHLPQKASILDLGCGSGRDSKRFIEIGYNVTALDACKEIALYAEQQIGQPVLVKSFQEIEFVDEFDGIWACASLLHCSKNQMSVVLSRIQKALKTNGILYMSFKWGNDEKVDSKGRFFNSYTCDSLSELINEIKGLSIVQTWSNTSPLRGHDQQWVNAIARREE